MKLIERESLEFSNGFDYEESSDLITNPGKFGGEPAYTPYYWNMTLESAQDDEIWTIYGDSYSIFKVTDTDRHIFSDLKDAKIVSIWIDEMGFVYSDIDPVFKDQVLSS